MSTATTNKTGPRGAKRVVFILLALAMPVLLVLVAEAATRLAGYGGYPPVFAEVATFDDGDALVSSKADSSQAYFFRNKDLPGTLTEAAFRSPKPDSTFRVFLVGGSAIKGFPQIRAFAPSTFLEAMLEDCWPDRDVEVINLGTTAVASFPVLEMMTAALEHEPDLVVVYSGHNEFFGAYGVASLNTVARTPRLIGAAHRLRSLGLAQAVDGLLAGGGGGAASSGKLLMEVMMASPFTGPDDPIRADAARNLGAHIGEMIRRCERAGAPIVVCTLPSNERGLAPLGTSLLDHLPAPQAERSRDLIQRAPELIAEDASAAATHLETLVLEAPQHARAHWMLASALQELGRFDEAAEHFARSVDLDPMPWRATTPQNDAIRDAVAGTGATLCDVQATFRAEDEGGSVGWGLMDDHVHMSLRGQSLVARAIVDALATMSGPAAVDPARAAALPGWEDYAERLGDNPFERHAVAFRMRRLFDVPFFAETNRHAIALMDQRMAALEEGMVETERATAIQWQRPEVNVGFTRPISSVVGIVALQEGRLEEAARLFFTTLRAMPRYTTQSVEYAYRYARTSQRAAGELPEAARAEAEAALDRANLMIANSRETQHPLHRHAGALLKVLGDHRAAIPHLTAARAGFANEGLVEIDQLIVHSFLEADQPERALELARWGQANAGRFAPAYAAMERQILGEGSGESP